MMWAYRAAQSVVREAPVDGRRLLRRSAHHAAACRALVSAAARADLDRLVGRLGMRVP